MNWAARRSRGRCGAMKRQQSTYPLATTGSSGGVYTPDGTSGPTYRHEFTAGDAKFTARRSVDTRCPRSCWCDFGTMHHIHAIEGRNHTQREPAAKVGACAGAGAGAAAALTSPERSLVRGRHDRGAPPLSDLGKVAVNTGIRPHIRTGIPARARAPIGDNLQLNRRACGAQIVIGE